MCGHLTRTQSIKRKRKEWFESKLLPALRPVSIMRLLKKAIF